jgi:hypothetical protein
MDFRKLIFLLPIILLLSACITHHGIHQDFRSLPSLEKQCEVLSKKRQPLKIKRSNRDSRKVRKNLSVALVTQPISAKPDAHDHTIRITSKSYTNRLFPDQTGTEIKPSSSSTPILIIDTEELATTDAERGDVAEAEAEPESSSIHNLPSVVLKPETENQKGIENNFIPALGGATGILSIILLSFFRKQSKQISFWASQNSWKSRGLITAAHFVTGASALAFGDQLSVDGFIISEAAKYIALSTIATAVFLYPFPRSANYLHRKTLDAVLFTSGAMMMLYAGNQYEVKQQQNPAQAVYSFSTNTQATDWHLAKKEISIPKIKKQDDPKKKSKDDKVGLTIVASLIFLGLLYLLAALSCSISCSGLEGLAVAVGIGGGIGLVIGFVAVIKSIFGKGRKKKGKLNSEPQAVS